MPTELEGDKSEQMREKQCASPKHCSESHHISEKPLDLHKEYPTEPVITDPMQFLLSKLIDMEKERRADWLKEEEYDLS